jgi:hypothetical protein
MRIGGRQPLAPIQSEADAPSTTSTPNTEDNIMVGQQQKSTTTTTTKLQENEVKKGGATPKSKSIAAYFIKSSLDSPSPLVATTTNKAPCTSTPISSPSKKGKGVKERLKIHEDNTDENKESVIKKTPVEVNKEIVFSDKEVQTDHPDLPLITGEEAPPEYWKQLAETRRLALEEALVENEILTNRVEELEKENKSMEEMVAHAKTLAEMINSITDDSGITADVSGVGDTEDDDEL